jgi:hypothetical protein
MISNIYGDGSLSYDNMSFNESHHHSTSLFSWIVLPHIYFPIRLLLLLLLLARYFGFLGRLTCKALIHCAFVRPPTASAAAATASSSYQKQPVQNLNHAVTLAKPLHPRAEL